MKKLSTLLIPFAFVLMISVVSCGEDEDQIAFLDESEAAEDIAATLTSDLLSLTEDIQELSNSLSSGRTTGLGGLCGISYDTTITREYAGQYVSADLSVTYGYELICTGSIPTALNVTMSSMGTRTTQRLNAQGSTEAAMVVTGILPVDASYIINGTLSRSGSLEGQEKSFSSSFEMEIEDLSINKSTGDIENGSSSFTYQASNSEGKSVSYSAVVSFTGGTEVTLVLNESRTFIIDLLTGEVTEEEG